MTSRDRRHLLEQLRAECRFPIAILFYHRVAKTNCDNPWSIHQDNFNRQLDWLQSNFELVSLSEAQQRIRQPHNDRIAVSITFDDGYADNAECAIPELVSREIPLSYFVSTDFVETGKPFPHDVELGIPLPPNDVAQLRDFVRMGIEIGSHTRSHANVATLTQLDQLRHEIEGSIESIRQWLGTPCRYFAFPYGLPQNMSQAAYDLLSELQMEGFCSGYGALNWPGNRGFHLRRFHADPGIERLKNWLTLDARKLVDLTLLPFQESSINYPNFLSHATYFE